MELNSSLKERRKNGKIESNARNIYSEKLPYFWSSMIDSEGKVNKILGRKAGTTVQFVPLSEALKYDKRFINRCTISHL